MIWILIVLEVILYVLAWTITTAVIRKTDAVDPYIALFLGMIWPCVLIMGLIFNLSTKILERITKKEEKK